jgi:hypothetical protein
VENKNTIENSTITVSEANSLIQCKRCRESIKHNAIICHHCGSMQLFDPWKFVFSSAKWIGILTGFTTLIIGMLQINEIFQEWQEKKKAVSELVEAAKIQENSRDFNNAWHLISEARKIDLVSKEARDYEIVLAKNSIRCAWRIYSNMEPKIPDYIEPALKALYRGAAGKSKKDAADCIAHVGWANWLRSLHVDRKRSGRVIDFTSTFEQAIEIDANNVYAHAGLGYTMLSWSFESEVRLKNIDKAMEHFSIALKNGRERDWVRKHQFRGLSNSWSQKGKILILQISNNIRKSNGELHSDASVYPIRLFRKIWLWDSDDKNKYDENLSVVLDSIPSSELLATYYWLLKDADFENKKNVPFQFHPINHLFIAARLTEANNDLELAFEMYKNCLCKLDETRPKGWTPDFNYRIYHIDTSYQRQRSFIIAAIERVKIRMSSGQK